MRDALPAGDRTTTRNRMDDPTTTTSPSGGALSSAAASDAGVAMFSETTCRGTNCRAPIRFVEMDRFDPKLQQTVRRKVPINLKPDAAHGTIVVLGTTGVAVTKARKAEMVANGERNFYVAHHATCPDAAEFRKGQR